MRTQKIRYSVSIGISLIISVLFFVACDDDKSVSLPTISPVAQKGQLLMSAESGPNADNSLIPSVQTLPDDDIPAWVSEPSKLPEGLIGKNNCTVGPSLDADFTLHPDGGCWEKAGPDGLVRQQFQAGHLLSVAACNGGPGDVSGIRLCGEPEQETPCGVTGPRGCVSCPSNGGIVCH
jgi:hypothetical protein